MNEETLESAYRRVTAITGIIGSGKTTVCELLKEKGALVLDADLIARQIFTPSYSRFEEVKRELSDAFPDTILFQGDFLDRRALAEVAFSSEKNTRRLNAVTHPHISRVFTELVEKIPRDTFIFYDIPLLFETGLNELVGKSIVVYAPEEVCVERASRRLGITEDAVRARLNRQISLNEKTQKADYIVMNTGTPDELAAEVEKLWRWLGETHES